MDLNFFITLGSDLGKKKAKNICAIKTNNIKGIAISIEKNAIILNKKEPSYKLSGNNFIVSSSLFIVF